MLGQIKGIEGDLRDTVYANLLLALHNPLGNIKAYCKVNPRLPDQDFLVRYPQKLYCKSS